MGLTGKTNEEKIWNYFKNKGLNDFGCSGLLGNLYAESGMKPNNLQNTGNKRLGMTDDEYVSAVDGGIYTKDQFVYDSQGFGIAQWTYWSRKKALYEFAKSQNKSVGDLEMQLTFLMKELNESYNPVVATLKTATSVFEASNAVLLKYERPADQSTSVQNKRASYSQEYYDKYATKGSVGDNKGSGNDMSYAKGKAEKLSANFKSTEFDCHGNGCCSSTEIDEKLVKYLQKIRDHFGKSITINSGYRCPTHNKRVGGATGSRHVKGMAADIVVKGVAPLEVAKYAESIGILGIGLYEGNDGNFVHVDTRTSKSFWYGHAQKYRDTFGGSDNGGDSGGNNDSNKKPNTTVDPNAKVEYAESKSESFVGTYKTTTRLNMRAGAGTDKTILLSIPKYGTVICYGYYTKVNGTNWYYVEYKNMNGSSKHTGFVSSKYLKKQ